MFTHLLMWFLSNEKKRGQVEQERGLRIVYAARSSNGSDLEYSATDAVFAECQSWVCEHGVASRQPPRFFNEVAKWTGTSFAAFGTVEVTNDRGESVRHWYVVELDSDFKVMFADMVGFDPSLIRIADSQTAFKEE